MNDRAVPASVFKARCLALLDDVAAGASLVITKRGKPVARVVPVAEPPPLAGSVTFHVADDELVAPLDEWHAELE